jgi:hypothetical protein
MDKYLETFALRRQFGNDGVGAGSYYQPKSIISYFAQAYKLNEPTTAADFGQLWATLMECDSVT